MRGLIILILLALLSCTKFTKKELYQNLYQNKFETIEEWKVEFIDSSFYVILTGGEDIDGITIGTWRIESGLTGTFLHSNNTIDSGTIKLVNISNDVLTFESKEKKEIKFKKLSAKTQRNPIGNWVCNECDSFPTYRGKDKWRHVTYEFNENNTFEINEENFRQTGSWKFSPSGDLIILNGLKKSGDFIIGQILILNDVYENKLTLNRKENGTILTRNLSRVKID